MCCFHLHFSDFIVLFFPKKIVAVSFEKNNLCKKREKITCCEEKSQPPTWISNGPSLRCDHNLGVMQ